MNKCQTIINLCFLTICAIIIFQKTRYLSEKIMTCMQWVDLVSLKSLVPSCWNQTAVYDLQLEGLKGHELQDLPGKY